MARADMVEAEFDLQVKKNGHKALRNQG